MIKNLFSLQASGETAIQQADMAVTAANTAQVSGTPIGWVIGGGLFTLAIACAIADRFSYN